METSSSTPPRFEYVLLTRLVALVPGGQRGIGLEIALGLVEAGAIVYCLDLPKIPDEQLVQRTEICCGSANSWH